MAGVRPWPRWGAGLIGALGLGVLVPLASVQQASAAELTLATWNTEHLAAADGAGCRPRDEADYRRLREVAERMDAHVIRHYVASTHLEKSGG
jgi:hypothetical protein